MGRFDALTQIDKKPVNATPPSASSAPTKPTPLSENQFASKPANQQTSKDINQQVSKPVNIQTSKEPYKQAVLPASQQASKSLKKFSSYLTEDSLKALKRLAFDAERKDYEVLQEAVDQYLANKK